MSMHFSPTATALGSSAIVKVSGHFSPTAIALGSSAIAKVSGHFSPTAVALGSSAIVKVSGQNCFWTLHGSLWQIRLGLLKGSAEGSTKVAPKFHQGPTKVPARVHQGSSSFMVSLVLSGAAKRFRLKRFCGRFNMQGSTKVSPVSPRLRKFRDLCGLLGQIRFGVPKGSVEGSPITSLNLSPSSSTLLAFFPNSVSFGDFSHSHSKGLGSK